MTASNTVLQLKAIWDHQRVKVGGPIVEADVDAFESNYNINLPTDFREYLIALNGMQDGVSDENLTRFWQLREIQQFIDDDTENNPAVVNYYVFADYCLNIFLYAIKLLPAESCSGQIYILGGETHVLIAETFTDFVSLYLKGEPITI